MSDTTNVDVARADVGTDGAVELPAWPGDRAFVHVLGKDGAPVFAGWHRFSDPTLELPVATRTHVAVVALKTGKGIDGAVIARQIRNRLVPVGKTGADGIAELTLPASGGVIPAYALGQPAYVARAAGYSLGGLQTGAGKGGALREGVTPDLHVHLGEQTPIRGRCLYRSGEPAAGLPLLVGGTTVHYEEESSRNVSDYRHLHRTGPDGRFAIHGAWDEFENVVSIVLTDEHLARLPVPLRRGPIAPAVLAFDEAPPADVGDVVLAELCAVDLHVVRPDGAPASGARVDMLYGADGMLPRRFRWWADRSGRLRLAVPRGVSRLLSVRHDAAVNVVWLGVEAPSPDAPRSAAVTVPLRPGVVCEGVVVRGDAPVSGIELTFRTVNPGQAWKSRPTDVPDQREDSAAHLRAFDVTRERSWLGLHEVFEDPVKVRTGDGGRFRVVLPAFDGSVRVRGRTRDREVDHTVSMTDLGAPLRLSLRAPRPGQHRHDRGR